MDVYNAKHNRSSPEASQGQGKLLETRDLFRKDRDSPRNEHLPNDIAPDPSEIPGIHTFVLIIRREID